MPTVQARSSSELAAAARMHAVRMVHACSGSHIGSSLSMLDLLSVLYSDIVRVRPQEPHWPGRDRFIMSKGHAAAGLYAVLAECGFIPEQSLSTYCAAGSDLLGHVSHKVPGVELSTGSLGHGLPVACGIALAGKRGGLPFRTYVLLSDGELDEGSNWEAILFARHHGLDNLTAIVDYNKQQGFGRMAEVLNLEPLCDKWRAFGWSVQEIDGHDHDAIRSALLASGEPGVPGVIVAHTIKGKGVSYMENQLAWHYKSPDAAQLGIALSEIGRGR